MVSDPDSRERSRPLADERQYSLLQLVSEIRRILPCRVVVLPRVEVNLVDRVFRTGIDDRNPKPEGEPRFEVDTTSCAVFALGEVGYEKSRTPDLGDDLIVDLVVDVSSTFAAVPQIRHLLESINFNLETWWDHRRWSCALSMVMWGAGSWLRRGSRVRSGPRVRDLQSRLS